MRKNDEAFLYVAYGLKLLNVQLIDFRSQDSSKLKSQCKQLRHTLIRTLIGRTTTRKLSDDELIQRYFAGKFLFRAGQCARRHGQLYFAYFCVLNASLSLMQCDLMLTSYEHCQSLSLLAELSHDLKRMDDCDLFVQAILKYIDPVRVGYEPIAIKSNWLSMTWNLYRGKVDRALNDSYRIKDLLNKIGAYEHLMSVATYSLQVMSLGRLLPCRCCARACLLLGGVDRTSRTSHTRSHGDRRDRIEPADAIRESPLVIHIDIGSVCRVESRLR
jgi:hypothetical protein